MNREEQLQECIQQGNRQLSEKEVPGPGTRRFVHASMIANELGKSFTPSLNADEEAALIEGLMEKE